MSRRVDDNSFDTRRAEWLMQVAIGLTDGTYPHPNPRVGALVLDRSGDLRGSHAHLGPGEPHAEVVALAEAGSEATGGTLVTTLEPCTHHGRTPPCVDAIIAAGVESVYVGAIDPDQRVAGAGIEALRTAGVEVVEGIAIREVVAADPGYFHHRNTGMPRVTLKYATTLDGQAAAADRGSRWITGPEARRDAHRLRARSDAVVVGAGTLRTDDPRLDVRIDAYQGPQPRPVIVAGSRPLPASAAVYARDPIVFVADATPTPAGVGDVVIAPGNVGVDLNTMLKHLGAMGVIDVLVEGGPTLAGALLRDGLVDELVVYLGAKVARGVGIPAVGGLFSTMDTAVDVEVVSVERLGPDVRITARMEVR
jgi:diaminohydroxyphosphoribosylaminopyrimidine deaminase / 5-amino-6-(5-phosphoribosylamino)uracil reductase